MGVGRGAWGNGGPQQPWPSAWPLEAGHCGDPPRPRNCHQVSCAILPCVFELSNVHCVSTCCYNMHALDVTIYQDHAVCAWGGGEGPGERLNE
jgi:hypothetical protein